MRERKTTLPKTKKEEEEEKKKNKVCLTQVKQSWKVPPPPPHSTCQTSPRGKRNEPAGLAGLAAAKAGMLDRKSVYHHNHSPSKTQ